MNILFIGSSGVLSLIPFKKLIRSTYSIAAVGVNKPLVFDNKIIALENESLALAARQLEIPLIDLSAPVTEVLQQCRDHAIDVILMSCYNRRLPETLINLVDKKCFNMHPSLLPAYRGPEPVFWQMQRASTVGVSWHQVERKFDAGAIISQKAIYLDDGMDYRAINSELAECGAKLMLELLLALDTDNWTASQQDPVLASYYPYPEQKDFVVLPSWSAQHAYNFMCATHVFAFPYHCQLGKQSFLLEWALDYDNNSDMEAVEVQGDRLYIPLNEGILCATYTGKLSA